MASSGYGIPNYGGADVSDADVSQLLEQFEDEAMLSLRLGSHRAGAGDSEAFTDVSKLTPSYLQDEDGGLDEDLAARLAALKAPRNAHPQSTDRGKSAGSASTETPDKNAVRKNGFPEGLPSRNLTTPIEGKGLGSEGRAGDDGQAGASVERDTDGRPEPDPEDVASLGSNLASRLRRLKGAPTRAAANQTKSPDVDVSNENASESERYASLQKRMTERDGAAVTEERTGEQTVSPSVEVVKPSVKPSVEPSVKPSVKPPGAPFIDLSRGGAKKQAAEAASRGGAKGYWSNPLAGLFGQRQSSGKSGGAPVTDVDNMEQRARELLAGFSKADEGIGASGGKSAVARIRPGSGAASIDPKSALFQDLQAVRVPPAEGVYDQVVSEELKEGLEVEALLAAMHDDVRIKRERRGPRLEAEEHSLGLQGEEEEDDSEESDTNSKKGRKEVEEIAAWASDAARLELVGADTVADAISPVIRSRRQNRRSITSDDDQSISEYESSSDSDGLVLKGRKYAPKRS